MCAHTPCTGLAPTHSGRKFFECSSSSAGNTPSATIRWSWYRSSMNMLIARSRWVSPASMRRHSDGGDDPRDDVERPGPVDATAVGVDGERDAHGEDVELGERLSLLQFAVLERRQLLDERSCRGARRAVGGEELVPGGRRGAHVCQGHRPTLVEPRCRTITKLCQPCELW
jgi:hypothetical protein